MNPSLSRLIRGAVGAALAMAVFTLAVGLFFSLTLLVISIEEGGTNFSEWTIPLTQMTILLTQGIGFQIGTLTITLIPLLLTALLVALLATVVRRLKAQGIGYCSGLVVWVLVSVFVSRRADVIILDTLWLLALKSSLVYSLGHVLAMRSELLTWVRNLTWWQAIPELWRKVLRVGTIVACVLLCAYFIIGFIAVFIWVVNGTDAVTMIFELTGMQLGSRILTTIASVMWLPNLCIWAMSWLFGSGFSIGELASFTMWSGQASELPPVPAFAIFPRAIENEMVRNAILSMPLVCGAIVGLVTLIDPHGFGAFSRHNLDEAFDAPKAMIRFVTPRLLLPLIAGCVAGVVLSIGSSLMFAASNGALGRERLSHVGVDIGASTAALTRPTLIGLAAAWLLTLIIISGWVAIHWLQLRNARRTESNSDGAGTSEVRTVQSSQTLSDVSSSEEQPKEEQVE